jgi:hypothetical protein
MRGWFLARGGGCKLTGLGFFLSYQGNHTPPVHPRHIDDAIRVLSQRRVQREVAPAVLDSARTCPSQAPYRAPHRTPSVGQPAFTPPLGAVGEPGPPHHGGACLASGRLDSNPAIIQAKVRKARMSRHGTLPSQTPSVSDRLKAPVTKQFCQPVSRNPLPLGEVAR